VPVGPVMRRGGWGLPSCQEAAHDLACKTADGLPAKSDNFGMAFF